MGNGAPRVGMEATIRELNNLLTDYRNDPGSLPTKALEYAIQWFTKGKERSDIGIEGAIKGLQELLDHRGSAADDRGGPGCLNNFSASISGVSAGVRLPSGRAAVCSRLDRASCRQGWSVGVVHCKSRSSFRWRRGRR
jgi:hypothetical protein